ncbi:MAG: hypothetical protein AAGA48_39840 [Myxococcota bacterium]
MTIPPSLCIDLGASFTKIAYRDRPDATSRLLQDNDLPDDQHFCIPSVAARNVARDVWVFGVEAMDLKSGSRVEVFQNWKAQLFDPDREVTFDVLDDIPDEVRKVLLEGDPALRALDVATRFLAWLHDEQLPAMLGSTDFRDAQVQLCVPDFVLDDPLAMRLEGILRDIGFRNASTYTLSEPKANLIGVLTEGANALTRNGRPNPAVMFGDTTVLKRLAHPGQAVLLVDVGAFTTDFALAGFSQELDAGFAQDPSHSMAHGIRKLDEWLLADAPDLDRERVEASAAEREHFHATIHGGIAGPRPEEFGLTQPVVDETVGRFTQAILDGIETFVNQHEPEGLVAAVLTGGGSNIRGIANRLARALYERDIATLHAPKDTDAPLDRVMYGLRPELVRGASAIGGCSILYRS